MASNLLAAGFELTVHNRTPGPDLPLAAQGARVAASPAAVAASVELLCLCVSDDTAVETVLLGPQGAAETLRPAPW